VSKVNNECGAEGRVQVGIAFDVEGMYPGSDSVAMAVAEAAEAMAKQLGTKFKYSLDSSIVVNTREVTPENTDGSDLAPDKAPETITTVTGYDVVVNDEDLEVKSRNIMVTFQVREVTSTEYSQEFELDANDLDFDIYDDDDVFRYVTGDLSQDFDPYYASKNEYATELEECEVMDADWEEV
jgi:hypothetical protein